MHMKQSLDRMAFSRVGARGHHVDVGTREHFTQRRAAARGAVAARGAAARMSWPTGSGVALRGRRAGGRYPRQLLPLSPPPPEEDDEEVEALAPH